MKTGEDNSRLDTWDVYEVSNWVQTLAPKFHFLSEVFVQHGVDGDTLLSLDDDALSELITSKFSRKVFMSRVNNLKEHLEKNKSSLPVVKSPKKAQIVNTTQKLKKAKLNILRSIKSRPAKSVRTPPKDFSPSASENVTSPKSLFSRKSSTYSSPVKRGFIDCPSKSRTPESKSRQVLAEIRKNTDHSTLDLVKSLPEQIHRPSEPSDLPPRGPFRKRRLQTWSKNSHRKDLSGDLQTLINLDLMLSLNKITEKEYESKKTKVVKYVTGTQITEATRERVSLNNVFSNSTSHSNNSQESTADSETRFNRPIEFDTVIPDWAKIKSERATKFEWDPTLNLWREDKVKVKLAKKPFSRGSLRLSFYMIDLTSKSSSTKLRSLYSQGLKNCKLKVGKRSIDPWEPSTAYFGDVHTQAVASKFAVEYNRYFFIPKKVAILNSWVYRLDDRCSNENQILVGVEDYLSGKYVKHIDNHGGDDGRRNTPAAFAHFTYEASERRLMVCDIQGVGDIYTDPQIHSNDGRGYGKGNLGLDGFVKFFATHRCSAICQHFKFRTYNPKLPIEGTAPSRRFMERDTISTIPTDTDNPTLPNSVRKFEERKARSERTALLPPTVNREEETTTCWCCVL